MHPGKKKMQKNNLKIVSLFDLITANQEFKIAELRQQQNKKVC
jgi:hypothetical protein